MAKDYKKTMNLPNTKFPMRARLTQNEPKRLKDWEEHDIYALNLKKNEGKEPFILHDGPPYANGPIHIGHAMNKILKDFINRYWSMQGRSTPYVPGWDCHGQPIEHKIEEKLGTKKFRETPQPEIRRLCHQYAEENIDIQRDGFKRLGVVGKWDDPYVTYNHEYEAADVAIFRDIYLSGAIYEGKKPVHWCPSCRTALAEAELEYSDVSSPSIYVRFKLTEVPKAFENLVDDLSIMIWTTTPWTLPANAGVALKKDAHYVVLLYNNTAQIVAHELVEKITENLEIEDYDLLKQNGEIVWVNGSELEGLTYIHPIFPDKTGDIILGDHVELTEGTGAVHTAPGHGMEDFEVGQKYGLPLYMPVDDGGVFTEEAGQFAGQFIFKANQNIIDYLRDNNLLFGYKEITHSYPHCWRCKNPSIFRATKQWFVSLDKTNIRKQAIDAIDNDVTWYPASASNRIRSMVAERPDWCISRQRSWGVPIPVFHCKDCGAVVANEETFDAVIDLFRKEGADAWFTKDPKEYLPENTACEKCGSTNLIPESDILDVWWESGVSHTGVLDVYDELKRPADVYLEGSDQHRGWFQSSLVTSVGAYGTAPYKSVISNGFINDEQGRKMSKSIGNVIDPNKVADQMGAEIIRLWVATTDTSVDVQISKSILERTSDAYRRIRNTFRFLLSNLEDFDASKNTVPFEEMNLVDQWMVLRIAELLETVNEGYRNYRFHTVYRAVYDFIVTELSNVYMDALKDRLYSDAANWKSRRSAQTALSETLSFLVRVLQPILAFTTDEVFDYMPESMKDGVEYALLLDWYTPKVDVSQYKKELEAYHEVLHVREVVTKALEDARSENIINKSQEARVEIEAPESTLQTLSADGLDLAEFFIVSSVDLKENKTDSDINVEILVADGDKCPRCWNVRKLNVNKEFPEVCERCARVLSQIPSVEEKIIEKD